MASVDVSEVRADIGPERIPSAPEPSVEPGGGGFRAIFYELRRVVWPTRRELIRYTEIVLGTVVMIAAFIGIVDVLLNKVTIPIYGNGY